jgi:hypothetical protein
MGVVNAGSHFPMVAALLVARETDGSVTSEVSRQA